MIIVLFPLDEPLNLVERSFRALADFFSRVPAEETPERFDRRVFRWVLCGEHGFVRNHRELCPTCGGYAEPLRNHALAKQLKRRRLETKRLIAAKARSQLRTR